MVACVVGPDRYSCTLFVVPVHVGIFLQSKRCAFFREEAGNLKERQSIYISSNNSSNTPWYIRRFPFLSMCTLGAAKIVSVCPPPLRRQVCQYLSRLSVYSVPVNNAYTLQKDRYLYTTTAHCKYTRPRQYKVRFYALPHRIHPW